MLSYITAISTELGIASNLVVAAMHDRASVNIIAMRTVSVVYGVLGERRLLVSHSEPRWS